MKILTQADYIRYVIAKLLKYVQISSCFMLHLVLCYIWRPHEIQDPKILKFGYL